MNSRQNNLKAFNRLLDIMDELREKCPWDKKQTMQSLKNNTIEETFELADAIQNNDIPEIKNELGDLMLHLIFYSKIASESQLFDIGDVLNGICDKLVYRHPHIYGDVKVENEEEVKQNWEKLKLKEGRKSVLEGVPSSLPALIKAYRIQEKVKGIGFEFENNSQILNKIKEEINEFENEDDLENKEIEFGDVLFSLINYARYNQINPENALEKTNRKFISRFQKMEQLANEFNKELSQLTINEMDKLWNDAKAFEK
ncbi:nucleoside triphosphate pyrophosphohydrolase [Apibacter sp. HY039]|uniref:nucleoside triphosphate pyrophosphohydrolase n=1 Tax=Apibacter sp. HY039 TaxID=2501476 RepID=UPI000FEC19A3|nr:nucleoside triphosphate pyrophosphohydrolase [Apibacter sp. HY039]